jgi:hypothetical protein
MSLTAWFIAAALVFLTGVGTGLWMRRRMDAKQGRYRVREEPNSHYAAPGVLKIERNERWESILQKSIHEVNRSEVERLLVKVRAMGVEKLTPSETAFLDRMTGA